MKKKNFLIHETKNLMQSYIPWPSNRKQFIFDLHSSCKLPKELKIQSYLGHGKYGVIYKAIYRDQSCVLKLIPLDSTIYPLKGRTSFVEFDNERKILDQIGKASLGPKLYFFGLCSLKIMASVSDEIKVQCGYLLMDYFDISLKSITNKTLDRLLDPFLTLQQFKAHLIKMTHFFEEIDRQIYENVKTSIELLGIYPRDLHRENIMYSYASHVAKIIDWGKAQFITDIFKPPELNSGNPHGEDILSANGKFYTKKFLRETLDDLSLNYDSTANLKKKIIIKRLKILG